MARRSFSSLSASRFSTALRCTGPIRCCWCCASELNVACTRRESPGGGKGRLPYRAGSGRPMPGLWCPCPCPAPGRGRSGRFQPAALRTLPKSPLASGPGWLRPPARAASQRLHAYVGPAPVCVDVGMDRGASGSSTLTAAAPRPSLPTFLVAILSRSFGSSLQVVGTTRTRGHVGPQPGARPLHAPGTPRPLTYRWTLSAARRCSRFWIDFFKAAACALIDALLFILRACVAAQRPCAC